MFMENKNNLDTNKSTNSGKNTYDDGNIPDVDKGKNKTESVEPLPESSRPRKDGPGGE